MSITFKKIKSIEIPFSRFSFKKLQGLVEKISLDIVLEAKANHRFESRTNQLERSISNNIKTSKHKILSTFFLDDRIANYGKYIHGGFKSWKPDPFLEDAFDKHIKLLKQLIRQKMKAMK